MLKILINLIFALVFAVNSWAIIPIRVDWSAATGATSYAVTSCTTGAVCTQHTETTDTEQVIYVDETLPIYLSIRTVKSGVYSDYSAEVACKLVTTTIPVIGGTINWNPIQAVENGGNHTMTFTPTAGYKMSAYRIGSTWTDNPASNDITFTAISENKTVEIVIQRIPTARP